MLIRAPRSVTAKLNVYIGAAPVRYDYHDPEREWYRGAKSTGEPYLSEPFFDVGRSNGPLVSISKPVYDERGGLIGVAGADVPLDRMRTIVANIRLRPILDN